MTDKKGEIVKSDAEWRQQLSNESYRVTRCGGTEPPFQNAYYDCKIPGTYRCVCCGQPLFSSSTKYNSGTGWPSFYTPIKDDAVVYKEDKSLPMQPRVEALCKRCHAHLGHVFDDGPDPAGKRFCMNSAALKLEPEAST